MDDCRDSITVIRAGNAAGDQGPFIYLCKGEKLTLSTFKDLEKLGAPPFSRVIMTPSAYLTDEAWLELVPNLCTGHKGLPAMVDGRYMRWLPSHLIPEAMPTFNGHNIFVQEDGATLQTNQAYDQYVAKMDKHYTRELHHKEQLNPWTLVAISIQALKKVTPDAWINSFKKVNIHPDFRMSFPEWIKKIDSEIATGERFFKGRTSLDDAMPSLWRNMSVNDRQRLMEMIDGFYSNATATEGPWEKKKNILDLVEFAPLDQMHRLRACYLTAKRDDRVITQIADECADSTINESSESTGTDHPFYEACKLQANAVTASK